MLLDCLRSRDRAPVGPIQRSANTWLLALVITAIGLLRVSGHAHAQSAEDSGGYIHPELERASAKVRVAGPRARHVALREVWRTWDRAEPEQVEAALQVAAQNPNWGSGEQAYARVLGAYARLRRGDVGGARKRIEKLGYVDKWLVLGPFDNTGKVGFERDLVPQHELGEPIVLGRAYSGKEGRLVRWRAVPDAFPFGWVDAGALLRPYHPICAFFASHIRQPGLSDPRVMSIWVGARGAHRVYWNDTLALEEPAYRGHDFDRRAALVALQPGLNRLTVEVCTEQAAPMLSIRIADPEGKPDARLQWQVEGSVLPVTNQGGVPAAKLPQGPLDAFEAQLRAGSTDAGLLEDYARYLTVTGGDNAAQHEARNASLSAAQSQPTAERWLLAARLTEDRNQRQRWLGQAELSLNQVPKTKRQRSTVAVKLARARFVEGGLSPQQALPLYQQLLAVDPDHLEALSGAVRLYEAVGLTNSALGLVQGARSRHPHAVGLLNLEESLLTALGRTREAGERRSLYSALRFDDQRPLLDKLELARRRQNIAGADHYAERLLELSPDNPWLYGVIANLHRSLGRPEQAMASYERALALAPNDTETLRRISDLYGAQGEFQRQLELLRRVLGLEPQNEEVRRYVAALEPMAAPADEAYAWKPERFLKKRHVMPQGYHKRTLLDLTVAEVFDNGSVARFRQVVFQPLTEAGAALARQYAFSFQSDRQRAQLRGAKVYRASGTVDEAIESGVGAANNPATSMYTSARTFYVQFPRLEPGDVVELRYRIDDVGAKDEWSGYFGEVHSFQQNVPIEEIHYTVVTPESRPLYVDVQRMPGMVRSEEQRDGQRLYHFSAQEVPALVPEPDMPPWSEVGGFVHVSTYPSYDLLGKWYWGLSRDQLHLDSASRVLLAKIVGGASSVREKVEAVYGWVAGSTRYVALEFGIHGYKPRPCSQTVARGWGDCKDKATVIVAFLKELGIDATVVLVRTAMRGRFQSSVASLSPFDHAIAYVPELDLYLDGTAEYTGTRELPAMDRGALGLQINDGHARLVHLPEHDPQGHLKSRHVEVFPPAVGGSPITIRYEVVGPDASSWRRRYSSESTRRNRVLEDLRGEFPSLELLTGPAGISVEGLLDVEVSPAVKVQGVVTAMGRREGASRSVAVLPSLALVAAHARLATRQTDLKIDSPATLNDVFVLHLAANEKVVEMPPNVSLSTPFGSINIRVRQEAGRVVAEGRLEIAVTRIAVSQYGAFREFCEKADKAFASRLVLGPKGK